MHIQLIQAPRSEGYVSNSRSACYAPIGLISIATYCQSKFPDATIQVLDGELLSVQQIIDQLQPGAFVGIETKMFNYASALQIAQAAKERDCIVIFGGVYASELPELILKNRSDVVDYIVVGYGEELFAEIVRGEIGAVQKSPAIVYNRTPDLNKLPIPDRKRFVGLEVYMKNFQHQHPGWHHKRGTNINTSQGCEFQCIFCGRQRPPAGCIQYRDPKAIWEEISRLELDYRVNYVVSFDDQFTQNTLWLRKLVRARTRTQSVVTPLVSWHIFSASQNIGSETVDLLRQLPVKHVFLGIETGDEHLAKTVGKGKWFSPSDCWRAARLLEQNSIKITPSFVLGLPGEDKWSMEDTYEFVRELKGDIGFDEIFAACLVPLPGSPAFQMLLKKCPELHEQDMLDGEELTKLWFQHFCDVDYETAREYVAKILDLGAYRITMDKGGH
ncbi:MAG: B12-binding domain-containing radical SAM protein [Candidatus Kerfeldbacteria bacterium]|jgi:radical SAM superfamily enzyme YgiQ (UPF0313 family)